MEGQHVQTWIHAILKMKEGIVLLLFSGIRSLLYINPVFADGVWPKWRIKLCITEPLTAYAGAVTGPWEIHGDCLQHMSYIIASIRTQTTTCKLQMCSSPVISVQAEKGKGVGTAASKTKSVTLFLSSMYHFYPGKKENTAVYVRLVFYHMKPLAPACVQRDLEIQPNDKNDLSHALYYIKYQ